VKLLINTAVVIGGDFNFVLCESHWSYRLSREFLDEYKSQIAYCIHLLSLALVALLAHFLLVPSSCVRMTLCYCSLQPVACGRVCICVTCLPTIFQSFLMLLKLMACGSKAGKILLHIIRTPSLSDWRQCH